MGNVKIGHASIDENGKVSGGLAGDQTGNEVCVRTWYNGKWDCVLRPKNPQVAEKSAIFIEQACKNDNIGYDQNGRNTLFAQAGAVNFDVSKIKIKCECDCSSLIHVAVIAAGANLTYGSNGFTTRTMVNRLVDSGDYEKLIDSKYLISDEYLHRGDILVKAGSHTVMVLENGNNISQINIIYSVKTEDGKILPEVTNLTDYAGIENKKITDIAMKVDKGYIKYQVHILGGKWLPYVDGYNWNDHKNGYAGNGKIIDAIRIYYSTPSDLVKNGEYRKAKYHVSPIGSATYYPWQFDDEVNKSKGLDGYAGAFGKAIDKFQISIE